MFDLKIVGGTLVDGTGGPPVRGDVAVEGGRIVAVGAASGDARRVLDAEGAIVTPGFVDLHTHYDGQVSWDPYLDASSLHGVTTCVMGNCGTGFAPVHDADHGRLIELMEGIEDIPGAALAEGIRWGWRSFAEYMDVIDRTDHAVDLVMQVPHDALRVFAMGARAVAEEAATEDDIARMRQLLAEALRAGAAGFSTGRSDNHRSSRGEATPASEAKQAELCGIAGAFAGIEHGVVQVVSDFDLAAGEDRFEPEFDIVMALARAANKPLSISLMQRDQAANQWRRILERVEQGRAEGLDLRVQAGARGIGVLLGLETTFMPFMGFPSYKRIALLSREERVRAMRDPAFKARLLTERSEPLAGDGSAIPPLADLLLANIDKVALRLFRLGENPDYEPPMESSLYAEAYAKHEAPLSVIYDALLEDEGKQLLYFPIYNYTEFSLDNVRTMLAHPAALPGLSDGGAHVGTVCDGSFSTFLLAHWVRDRKQGRFPLEAMVKKMTHDTAAYMGLGDRGVLRPGKKADLNIIDLDALALERPRLAYDLPAGGRRLVQSARGYRATVVSGKVTATHGSFTGELPGRVVRAFGAG